MMPGSNVFFVVGIGYKLSIDTSDKISSTICCKHASNSIYMIKIKRFLDSRFGSGTVVVWKVCVASDCSAEFDQQIKKPTWTRLNYCPRIAEARSGVTNSDLAALCGTITYEKRR